MKYLKKYNEAFESDLLSGVLKYIDNVDSKKRFLENITNICTNLDYPLSKISDDYFSYVNITKALTINGEEGDKTEGVVKLIKFWFDINGKLIKTTGCDGFKSTLEFSDHNLDNMVKGPNIINIKDLVNGQKVIIEFSYGDDPVIGTVFIDNDNYYVIHNDNHHDGGSSYDDSSWRELGRYSWNINDKDYYSLCRIIDKKDLNENILLNKNITIYNRIIKGSNNISLGNTISESELKDASFSIIFDLGKLRKSEYYKLSDIKRDRKDSRKGASILLSDEEVKNTNMDRYISKMKLEYNNENINNLDSLIYRILGYKNMFFTLRDGKLDTIQSVIDSIFQSDDYNNERVIKSYFMRAMKENEQTKDNINKYKILKTSTVTPILDKILLLSNTIFNKVKSLGKIENLSDIEIVFQKIKSIENILNSNRYEFNKYNISSIQSLRRTVDGYDFDEEKESKVLKSIDDIIEVIKKL